jgi:hypothetical protein
MAYPTGVQSKGSTISATQRFRSGGYQQVTSRGVQKRVKATEVKIGKTMNKVSGTPSHFIRIGLDYSY